MPIRVSEVDRTGYRQVAAAPGAYETLYSSDIAVPEDHTPRTDGSAGGPPTAPVVAESQHWIPPRDEQNTTHAALDAWAKGLSKQVELLKLKETSGLARLDADGAKALVLRFNGKELPGTLFELATATARATVEIRKMLAGESKITEEGDGILTSTSSKSESATYFEQGWVEAVEARHKDNSIDENVQDDNHEIAASLKQCPRLHLLSKPQLVSVLHMTDPQELNDMKLWRPMCNFDKIVLANHSSVPLNFGNEFPRSVAKDVVAVQQCDGEGRVVATLHLLKPHAQIFQHDFVGPPPDELNVPQPAWIDGPPPDELNVPQAAWIEGLFSCIEATLQHQLVRSMGMQGGSVHLCDMLQTACDGGGDDQSKGQICLQVAMLAFNIRISDILSEVLEEEGELEKRQSDAWAEAIAAAEAEFEALQAARNDTLHVEEGSLRAQQLKGLAIFVDAAIALLAKKQWKIRYRRHDEEVQVAMQVAGPSGRVQWHGCNYGWELTLQGRILVHTDDTYVAYLASFANMRPLVTDRDHEKVHYNTVFVTGKEDTGKLETAKDFAKWVVGVFSKGLSIGDTDVDLGVYSKAQRHFPVVLMCDEANRAFSDGALSLATQQPRLMPGSLHITYNPDFLGSVSARTVEQLKNEIVKVNKGSEVVLPLPFTHEADQRRLFFLLFPADQRCRSVAAVLARFVSAAATERGEEAMSSGTLNAADRFFNMRFCMHLLNSMQKSHCIDIVDDTSRDAMVFMFGHLGEFFTVDPTAAQKAMFKAAGGKLWLQSPEPAKHMVGVLGEPIASRRYHLRLIRAVYSSSSNEQQGIDTMLDQQLAAGRRIHAADLAALLCEFPDVAVKVMRKIGLQDSQGTVSVGWAGTRRVGIDFMDVHISPSGEGAQGPAMLWAGKDARGLLGTVEPNHPEQVLKPQVVGFDGAITTLELLPAIVNSPVSAELLTCPAMGAIMEAKWRLLKPWWCVDVGIFSLVFGLYLAHTLVEEPQLQACFATAASVFTAPLFVMEWRHFWAGIAMSGVGAGRLSKRVKYLDVYQGLDLLGLLLVCATNAVLLLHGRQPTLIAFTVLLLCWKFILFMRINRTMGFLMATLIECLSAIRAFLFVLALAVTAFSLSFNLQMQAVDTVATAAADDVSTSNATAVSSYGKPGLSGMQSSLWATSLLAILGDFNPDIFWEGGVATIISFGLITTIVNIIMLNVLIAIVGQAQEAVLEEGDATYASLFAETLAGLDAIHPRVRRKAFCGDVEVPADSKEEHHNEVQYLCARQLVKRAFHEPHGKYKGATALRDVLATVHVLSARSHPKNKGAWEWYADRDDLAEQGQEMEQQMRDVQPRRATEAISDQQLEALQVRLQALNDAKLISDEESCALEDAIVDCIEMMSMKTSMEDLPVVQQVLKMIWISEKVKQDRTFARQLKRKYI